HVLLWKDPQVTVSTMPLRGGWKRLFAGLPLIMTQAQGPGHIAFSRDAPGEMVALPLQPGQAVDVREHVFMVATGQVTYDWFSTAWTQRYVWLRLYGPGRVAVQSAFKHMEDNGRNVNSTSPATQRRW